MYGFMFICILFCGVSGFNELSSRSLSSASRSVSDSIGTVHDVIDIKREFDTIKGRKLSGGKRTRRGSEITLESVTNASRSTSDAIHTVHEVIDIKKKFDEIRKGRKGTGSKRTRRGSTSNGKDVGPAFTKITAGIGALLKTYLYQPIAHGNFLESTVRSYHMLESEQGKYIFGTLDGELNQSFRSICKARHPRTGDIISCRIPTSRMAEHYMMVINKKIAEVFVVGGKETNNGVISAASYLKSSYINSTECLHHQNRIISRAEEIDEANGNDNESELRYQQIFDRFNCTVQGNIPSKFVYDLMSCNCQDLVLYWAYGYVENKCASGLGCTKKENTLPQIYSYIDPSEHLNHPVDISSYLINEG